MVHWQQDDKVTRQQTNTTRWQTNRQHDKMTRQPGDKLTQLLVDKMSR